MSLSRRLSKLEETMRPRENRTAACIVVVQEGETVEAAAARVLAEHGMPPPGCGLVIVPAKRPPSIRSAPKPPDE